MNRISRKARNIIILVVCACVFTFSLYTIAKRIYGYYHERKLYEEIKSQEETKKTSTKLNTSAAVNTVQNTALPYTVEEGDQTELGTDGILNDYTKLKKKNAEMIGWIKIPGFKKPIDYPVMQAGDNEFYLKKDFYGNNSYTGSIFMDARNNPAQVDRHIIIYGHSMKDLSMFGNLKNYSKRPEEYTRFTKIYLDLMNTRLEYEVFSTYIEHASYNYRQIDFSSDSTYMDFLKRISSKSVNDYKVKLTPKDKILTLSTCNRTLLWDGRSVIHARLVRQITYSAP